MKGLFLKVLELSLSGSVVILAVMALRLLLKKAPRRVFCLLWLLAALRLMLPFEFQSSFSLQPELPPVIQEEELRTYTPPVADMPYFEDSGEVQNIPSVTPETQAAMEEPKATEEPQLPDNVNNTAPVTVDYVAAAAWLWAAGMAGLLLYSLLSYYRLKRRVRKAVIVEEGVWVCGEIETAFVLGFFRPQIYLPVGLPREVQRLILAHERAHVARFDHWSKAAGFAVLAVHWFNPLVWAAFVLLCRDIEMACDEAVVKTMTVQERKLYSAALLRCSDRTYRIAACPVAFAEISVKRRILNVLNYKKKGFWIILIAILALVFVAVCFLTSPAGNEGTALSEETAPAEEITETEPSAPRGDTEEEATVPEGTDAWGVYIHLDDDRMSNSGADLSLQQYENGWGTLNTTDEYWIEKKNGEAWEPLDTVLAPQWKEASLVISKTVAHFEYIDWTSLYGQLPGGVYRMGKKITCYDAETGYRETLPFYAEFEIVENDLSKIPGAEEALERCYAALEAVKTRSYVHCKSTSDLDLTQELWWHNGDYLSIMKWPDGYIDDTHTARTDILARLDGVGYRIVDSENGDSGMALSTLSPNRAGWVMSFSDMPHMLFYERDNKQITFPADTGVISDEVVSFCQSWTLAGGVTECVAQLTYRFDAEGDLTYMEYKTLHTEEPGIFSMEIYDTAPEEIDAVIRPYTQNLVVDSFSWEDARAKYTEEKFNIREDGFVNTGATVISGPVEAAQRALGEYPNLGEYLNLTVFHDEETGMWKVTVKSYYEYQSCVEYRDIYLDENGITQLLVYEGPLGTDEPRK